MPHRLYHVLDCVIMSIATIVTAAGSGLMLAELPSPGSASAAASAVATATDLKLLLLPLIGSLIASGGMIMLNPAPETRRIVIGRACFALIFGATGPQIVALFHPSIAGIIQVPAVPLLLGLIISVVIYAVSKPFAQKLYRRSDRMAEQQLNEIERRFGGKGDGEG